MGDVIRKDFGKASREAARQFARLFGIVEALEEDILNDPVKYINAASVEIGYLRAGLSRAEDALRLEPMECKPGDGPARYQTLETIRVEAGEWHRAQEFIRRVRSLLKPRRG